MQKFLRTLMLSAVMLLPFASHAQTCTPISTFPVTYGFEDSEGFTTTVTGAAACTTNVFNSCWRNEATTSVGSNGTRIWHIYGGTTASQIHSGAHSLILPDKGSSSAGVSTTMLTFPAMSFTNPGGYVVSFWIYRSGTSSNPEGFKMYVSNTDTIDANAVELGHYSRNRSIAYPVVESTSGWYQYETAPITMTGTVYLIFEGQSYYGSSTYIDDIVISEAPSCFKVTSLAIDEAQTTSNSLTLTWTDAINAGATYTIYDMSDTSVVATGITGTTYTITGLTANTQYSFGVQTNCGGGDIADGYTMVSGRTSCSAEVLPFSETFSASLSSDPCWRGASILYADGVSVTMGNNSNWTYTSSESNGIAAGHYRVNIYGTGCYKWLITPEIDLTTATSPMLTFDAVFTAYSGTGAASGFESNTSQMFLVLVSTNNGVTWSVASNVSLSSIAGTSYATQYVDLSAYAGNTVRVAFYAQSTTSGGDNNLHLDNISIDESTGEICYPAATLAASNVTSNSATITWTGDAASYEIYNMADTSLLATVTTTSYDLTGLTPNTEYQYGVVAICSSSESPWSYVSFRTSCAAYSLPFTESFSATLASDPCWRGASIVYTDSVAITMGANNNWTYTSSVSNGIEAGHYRVNIYGSSCYKWLITPEIDLTTATSPMLTFDAVFTAYSGTGAASGFESNDSQKFMVLVSTNNGANWTIASDIPLTSIAGTAYTIQTVNLSAYAGETVRVAFYAQSTVSGGDNNLHIDNIAIDEVVGEFCYPVTALTASNITTDGATLTWTGDAASYNVYSIVDTVATLVQNVTTNTITLTGLNAMTTYTYGVSAVCTSSESDMMTLTFATACTAVAIPYTEDFTATNPTLGCWSMSNVVSGTGVTSDGTFRFYYTTNPPQYLISPELSGTDDGVKVSFLYKVSSTYYTESFQLGYSTTTNDTAAFTWGTEQANLSNQDWALYEEILPAGVKYVSVKSTAYDAYFLYIDSVVFNLPPACMPVTDLTVDSTTATSVFLSWNGTATSYNVYNAAGALVGNTANTTYEVTGLTAATGYTFGVTSVCGTDEGPVVTVSATTDCADGSCTVKIYATDSYGDGWSNSTLTLTQNGATVATYTMASQGQYNTPIYDTFQVSVCSGVPVSFSWISASTWDSEAGFQILDGNDTVLYTVTDASTLTDGAVFYTVADACGSNIPTPPALDSMQVTIAVNDATMGTTIPAPGVHYFYEGDTASVIAVPNTGYQLAGWTFVMTVNGATYYDTTVNMALTNFFDLFSGDWVVESGDHIYAFNVTANFVVGAAEPDTVTVNIAVSDPTEGTTNPAPGTHYFTNGETCSVIALPATGYTIAGWSVEVIDADGDTVIPQQVAPYEVDDVFDIFTSPIVANAMFDGYVFNVMPVFQADSTIITEPDSLILITAVNDPTMGTIIPAPGTHVLYAGDTFSVRAVPNAGYHVESWHIVYSYGPYPIYDTVINMGLEELFSLDTADYYFGMTMSFTANFAVGDAPEMHDSLTVITSVNDPNMGTITPAPGTHYYVEGDVVTLDVQPNTGYYLYGLQVSVAHPEIGTLIDSVFTSVEDVMDELMGDSVMVVNEDMIGFIISLHAIFQPEGQTPENYTVTVNYDATRGNVTSAGNPVAAGTVINALAGQSVSLTANAHNNYEFVGWVENGDTVSRSTAYTIENIDANHSLTAVFVEKNAIDDVDMENVTIYSTDNTIVVRGAEGKPVVLFDVNGRMMSREASAAETVEFRVNNSGVYLVKVANAAAKRVVVIR